MKREDANVPLIREFFSTPAKPVTIQEMKDLSASERQELADLIRETIPTE